MNKTNSTTLTGLIAQAGTRATTVPLEGVHIEAHMEGPCVQVAVRQRYRNNETNPIEAVYVFPLPEDAAVCGFRARIGETEVTGHVEARDAAFTTYDNALMDGHIAALVDQERPNIFTVSLGNLPPGETAVLELRYVMLLRREGNAYRLMFPTTVSPRYVPGTPPQVGEADGDRVNPERWSKVPYGLQFDLFVEALPLRSIECVSHSVRTQLQAGGVHINLSQRGTALDRDLVMLIEPEAQAQPHATAAREADGSEVVLVQFTPDVLPARTAPRDLIFLLDCSGSMQGTSMEEAKRALQLCVRALAPGDRFNICLFGSTHQFAWQSSRIFDEDTLREATEVIAGLNADLGGTELLEPLKMLLKWHERRGFDRSIILLTDGQVANEAEIIDFASRHAKSTRIFTIGIGAGVSEHLVRGLARAAGGETEMVYPGENIEPKVLRTFARLSTGRLANLRLDTQGAAFQLAPREIRAVCARETLSLFAHFDTGAPDHVALLADGNAWHMDVTRQTVEPTFAQHSAITLCWARQRIRDIEEGASAGSSQPRARRVESDDAELVALGVRYGLLSRATSYVAVQMRGDIDANAATLRRVPVALTTGWGDRAAVLNPDAFDSEVELMEMPQYLRRAPDHEYSVRAPAALRRIYRSLLARPEPKPSSASHAIPAAPNTISATAVMAALMTQHADGSFGFEAAVALDSRLRLKRLPELLQRGGAPAMTLFVVLLLEQRAADHEDLWRPAVQKARAWLGTQTTAPNESDVAAMVLSL